MDRTSIIVIVVCLAVLVLWSYVLVPKLYPPKPLPPGATNAPATTFTGTSQPVNAPVAPSSLEVPPPAPKLVASTNVPEELTEVTNENARYTFTSHGGGLKLIELVQYLETTARQKNASLTNGVAALNKGVTLPVLAVLGDDSVQDDAPFALTQTAT